MSTQAPAGENEEPSAHTTRLGPATRKSTNLPPLRPPLSQFRGALGVAERRYMVSLSVGYFFMTAASCELSPVIPSVPDRLTVVKAGPN